MHFTKGIEDLDPYRRSGFSRFPEKALSKNLQGKLNGAYLRRNHAHVVFAIVSFVNVVDFSRDLLKIASNVMELIVQSRLLQN